MNMKVRLWYALGAAYLMAGCTIGNGQICGPQTPAAYCDKEAYESLKYPKPYGAHWIKEGMTRESRRVDIAACGARGDESVNFLPQEIQAAKQAGDANNIHAEGRLTQKWTQCMRAKGYVYLQYCDARCLHP